MECAAREMGKSIQMSKSRNFRLAPAELIMEPWDTSEILAEDIGQYASYSKGHAEKEVEPLLTVKHVHVQYDQDYPMPLEVDAPIRLEMLCKMHQQSLTSFQSLAIDGCLAELQFAKVPDVDLLLKNFSTRNSRASYDLPLDRNGFVCHLVNLVSAMIVVYSYPLTYAAPEH
jgi:hypothetical protein